LPSFRHLSKHDNFAVWHNFVHLSSPFFPHSKVHVCSSIFGIEARTKCNSNRPFVSSKSCAVAFVIATCRTLCVSLS
jgi:hypothetical protein